MNGYLLDTNALSEGTKKLPNKGMMSWLRTVDQQRLCTSCLVIGELYKGVELSKNTAYKAKLELFVKQTVESFVPRILVIDNQVCKMWAKLCADAQKIGKTPPAIDSLLAAQAIQHDLTLVTRNTKDFEQFPNLKSLCPWS